MKLLLTLPLLCTLLPAQAQKPIRRLDNTTITPAAAEAFATKTLAENHVTGAQLAILNHGKLAWSYAYGIASKDPADKEPRPFDRNTNTWAASLTKAVFATYVMTLVERGQFDLDKPLAQQLSKPLDQYASVPNYETFSPSASALVKDPAWPLITPRMVLSHTSGLGNLYFLEPDEKMHLHYPPGSRFLYSGDGLNILQLVLEEKLGKPLDILMNEALFQPLNMTRTGLAYRDDFAPNVADRFDRNEKFIAKTRRNPRAAGSMTTTADDLGRFLTALMANKILTAKTKQQMLAPQIAIPYTHQFQFGPQANDESPEPKAVGLSYGLGWLLYTHTKFGPAFVKEGHGDGAQNYMICFEKSQSCMVLLTNSDNGEQAFRPLLEHLLGDTVTPWEWECYTPTCIEANR